LSRRCCWLRSPWPWPWRRWVGGLLSSLHPVELDEGLGDLGDLGLDQHIGAQHPACLPGARPRPPDAPLPTSMGAGRNAIARSVSWPMQDSWPADAVVRLLASSPEQTGMVA
jgi:hypothetical protein